MNDLTKEQFKEIKGRELYEVLRTLFPEFCETGLQVIILDTYPNYTIYEIWDALFESEKIVDIARVIVGALTSAYLPFEKNSDTISHAVHLWIDNLAFYLRKNKFGKREFNWVKKHYPIDEIVELVWTRRKWLLFQEGGEGDED